jgi:hypothetical protein
MYKKLESIVNQIENVQNDLSEVEKQIDEIDAVRLEKIIKLSKKGLTFLRIISSKCIHNCNGNCYHNDECEFFEYRGILVSSIDNGGKRDTGYHIEDQELWLLEDGTFIETKKTGYHDYYQNAWWNWEREIVRQNGEGDIKVDPLLWNVDDIIEGINTGLKERLNKLGERTKAQKERLEKLQAIRI